MYMKPRDKNMVTPYETASLEQKRARVGMSFRLSV